MRRLRVLFGDQDSAVANEAVAVGAGALQQLFETVLGEVPPKANRRRDQLVGRRDSAEVRFADETTGPQQNPGAHDFEIRIRGLGAVDQIFGVQHRPLGGQRAVGGHDGRGGEQRGAKEWHRAFGTW